jgi:serine/threonine protein kinase
MTLLVLQQALKSCLVCHRCTILACSFALGEVSWWIIMNLMLMHLLQIKCYMHQLLSGLEHCHGNNVLHRDIKGSNLLLDNNGILKIADFGLAALFDPHHKRPMTSRVVTLWYRPPELLLGATDYGVGIDLWSAGCILAELLYGKPIMPGRTEVSLNNI